MLEYMYDHHVLKGGAGDEHKLYTTYLASAFRSMRFGIKEAHGKGMALQFNYLMDQGGFVANPDGTYAVNFDKIKPAVQNLVHELLTIEATGDYTRAQHMLGELSVIRPGLATTFASLSDIPVDIEPQFTTASKLLPNH
ncbi:MAG: hypothetical protein JO022_16035 [Acidobacteriaceae bacterium]|nr:hypothetical protein [Acidobacteriaceae bacterium]